MLQIVCGWLHVCSDSRCGGVHYSHCRQMGALATLEDLGDVVLVLSVLPTWSSNVHPS